MLTGLGRSTFYCPKPNWRKIDAAVIDTINEVLKKSPERVSGSALVEFVLKAIRSIINGYIE